jgi:magnesium chelatase subunit I
VLGGKIEFESGEEGREDEVLTHLLRVATADTVRAHFRDLDFAPLVDAIEDGTMVTTGERMTARDFLGGLPVLGESELYDDVYTRLGAHNDGQRAAAMELALEGLYLARKIGKDTDGTETVYG